MITDWTYIEQHYQSISAELLLMEPISGWQVKPSVLRPTAHKTKYGMADIKGVVYINHAFVGTSAIHLLDVTIRHELAHLCVGLEQGHNYTFKAKANQFKAHFGRHLQSEINQVHDSIGHKYTLYANLENGDKIFFRRVHRKHRKYTHYKAGRFRYLTIKGIKVLSFNYVS